MERVKLVIGPGPSEHIEGVVRIDIIPEWADIVADIRKGIPMADESVDEIDCQHVLEHVQLTEDFLHVMREMKRVLKPGGTIYIEVPHKDSDMAYESIEHTRFFTENSFMNFYHNQYADKMNYPLFTLVHNGVGKRDHHKVVQVWLQK